jgi:hypothetical protein
VKNSLYLLKEGSKIRATGRFIKLILKRKIRDFALSPRSLISSADTSLSPNITTYLSSPRKEDREQSFKQVDFRLI